MTPAPKPPAEPPPSLRPQPSASGGLFNGFMAADAAEVRLPKDKANGKSSATSLMQPQDWVIRILPENTVQTLFQFAKDGCPARCGAPWSQEAVQQAKEAGPHVSALQPDNVELIWEDLQYQRDAGFVKILTENELFGDGTPENLKISRVAVVPQTDRRGRIILNLSAPVETDDTRRKRRRVLQPSVNDTTEEAEDQEPVKALGTAMPALLMFMRDVSDQWEIDWQKVDLSDGFWRMIVEAGEEYNFVYQLPRRPGDTETHYVVPSSLQMGWKNSPAYFSYATEAGRELIKRVLALTLDTGMTEPHRHEDKCLPEGSAQTADPKPPWTRPEELAIASRVFVDDYINGVAGPLGRESKREELQWVTRATLHSIHGIFPPPDVLGHDGGKDSISEKKLNKGDGRFKRAETLLGARLAGGPGADRTVGLPKEKLDKYVGHIDGALAQRNNYVTIDNFRKLHGKLQYCGSFLPHLRGFMSPLNRALRGGRRQVGLGRNSDVRPALEAMKEYLQLSETVPAHITQLVPPLYPHVYGSVDAAAVGMGGTWLPGTTWIQPAVWRVEFPTDIREAVQSQGNEITNSDVEAVAAFVAECMLEQGELLGHDTAGVSSYLSSDNTPTVSWLTKQDCKATSQVPETMLRLLARRQHWVRRGPFDIVHWEGKTNLMADFCSRSYEQGFHASRDDLFLTKFCADFPLPAQLGSWRLVRPSDAIISAAFSILRRKIDYSIPNDASIGDAGLGLPLTMAKTLGSRAFRTPPSTWSDSRLCWPLLEPSGRENSAAMASKFRERPSRKRYESARSSWSIEDLATLGDALRNNSTSTTLSGNS